MATFLPLSSISKPTIESGKTIGMQETGLPLPLMVLAILMVLGGVLAPRK